MLTLRKTITAALVLLCWTNSMIAETLTTAQLEGQIASLQKNVKSCTDEAKAAEQKASTIRQALGNAGDETSSATKTKATKALYFYREQAQLFRDCAKSARAKINSLRQQIEAALNPQESTIDRNTRHGRNPFAQLENVAKLVDALEEAVGSLDVLLDATEARLKALNAR